MATISLNQSVRASVFRKVVEIVRIDPTCKRLFREGSLKAWTGKPQDAGPLALEQSPCLRLTPGAGPETWSFPDAMVGALFLDLELVIKGTDADDVMNVWEAIQRAIYPVNQTARLANIAALQAAGAYTGLPSFSAPAVDLHPDGAGFFCTGQIKIDVLLQLNS